MNPKRLLKTAILFGLGLSLASCGSVVADHWPHWAGGMPDDVPPRPGSPGYAEFVAHGQATQQADTAANARPSSAPIFQGKLEQAPARQAEPVSTPQVRAARPDHERSDDSSVVNGGLY